MKPGTEDVEMYRAKEPDLGFPKWFGQILEDSGDKYPRLNHALDHQRRVGKIAISEPYGISDTHLNALSALCKENSLRYTLIGKSHWCPSETLRIVIWRPEDDADLKKLGRDVWLLNRGE